MEKEPLLSSSDPECSVSGYLKPTDYRLGMYGSEYNRIHNKEKVTKKTAKKKRASSNMLSQITEETSSSTESEIVAAKEVGQTPVPVTQNTLLLSTALDKDWSDTSSSSTSEYTATYEPRPTTETVVNIDTGGKSNYEITEYRLKDCNLVDTAGLSYSQVVEDHLHRNPSLETSKSSVELEKPTRAETVSINNEKTPMGSNRTNKTDKNTSHLIQHQYQRENNEDNEVKDDHGDVGDADYPRPAAALWTGVTSNLGSDVGKMMSSVTHTSHFQTIEQHQVTISGGGRSEERHQHQHGSQTQVQTNGDIATSTTSNYENNSQQFHFNDDSRTKFSAGQTNTNGPSNVFNPSHTDQEGGSGDISQSVADDKAEDETSHVFSAKERENIAPTIRTSEVPGYFNYNKFLSGMEDNKATARMEMMEDMTSTPRESVRVKDSTKERARVKADSTSSSMSNEEIVRSHLKQFDMVIIRG